VVELRLPTDYEDLLRELVEGGVEFVLIGGWAVAAHGHPRATDDLDVLVRPTPANARRVVAALQRFGAPLETHAVTEKLFSRAKWGYRMGRKPQVIELLARIDGVTFADAVREVLVADVAGLAVPVIGRAALLANKRAAGRPKDLADVDALERDDS
jgi:hypothetical protein